MGDRKRSSPTIVSINEASPNGTSISKKRKITASSSHLHHQTITPVTSVNSASTVASDEICSDHSPLPCFSSSNVVKERDATVLDPELKTKGFETVDSNATKRNLKSFREEEIDEFFARFEREEQKRFSEKYNFDIVRDVPLEGRYEWVRLH
ncbi:cyclin-dependent kinase inhibitor 6 [Vicia villosa]|uniref:cyclin-dependent kinase inhibitor 6 n=1 Tax=Vicia villosa TaxID=3911 RepID=UPI00273B3B53|nr:cyclin-dependent kinase inhibitor 6 [Vicia villosa]